MKRILIFSFISFNIFAGNFNQEKETQALLSKSPAEISVYVNSLTAEQNKLLREHIINNNRKIFLEFIKPNIESFCMNNKDCKLIDKPANFNYVKFIDGGKNLVIVSKDHQQFDIYELSKLEKVKTINTGIPGASSDISQDGKFVITGKYGGITLFNTETQEKRPLRVEQEIMTYDPVECITRKSIRVSPITFIKFSKDSKFALIATHSYVYYFDLETFTYETLGQVTDENISNQQIHSISISKDGKYAVAANYNKACVYDLKTKKLAFMPDIGSIDCATFSDFDNFLYFRSGKNLFCMNVLIRDVISYVDLEEEFDPYASVLYYTMVSDEFKISAVNANATAIATDSQLSDCSKWAVEELSLAQLIVLVKAYQAKDIETVTECYNFFDDANLRAIAKFFNKIAMSLYFDAPREVNDIVKNYMG